MFGSKVYIHVHNSYRHTKEDTLKCSIVQAIRTSRSLVDFQVVAALGVGSIVALVVVGGAHLGTSGDAGSLADLSRTLAIRVVEVQRGVRLVVVSGVGLVVVALLEVSARSIIVAINVHHARRGCRRSGNRRGSRGRRGSVSRANSSDPALRPSVSGTALGTVVGAVMVRGVVSPVVSSIVVGTIVVPLRV